MRRLLVIMLPSLMFAQDLKSLLEYAHQNNNLVKSYALGKESKAKSVEARESSYYPIVDIGANYKNISDLSPIQIRDTYTAYAKASVDIYDGGSKSALLKQSKDEFESSEHDEAGFKKSLSMLIVKDFYELKGVEATLRARDDAKKSIDEQLKRTEAFLAARLATQDDVDRLVASKETNEYEIESLAFERSLLKKRIELRVTKSVESFDESHFEPVVASELELSDEIKSLKAKQSALLHNSRSAESLYYPAIKLEDTYSFYEYGEVAPSNPLKIDRQNTLMLSLNMRLYDDFTAGKTKEAISLNSQAIGKQILFKTKEQKMEQELALEKIKSVKLRVASAKSALDAATSAFRTINEKYNARIVDNVTYLDALSARTTARALHERALNELDLSYAQYYFASGKNLEEFIR